MTMTRIDSLFAEFAHEAQTTRKHLERLPDDQLGWRPHAKSFTAGQLASHMVDCILWTAPIFGADELDMDTGAYKPCGAMPDEAPPQPTRLDVAEFGRLMAAYGIELVGPPPTH